MLVFSIDPGLRHTGVAVLELNEARNKMELHERLKILDIFCTEVVPKSDVKDVRHLPISQWSSYLLKFVKDLIAAKGFPDIILIEQQRGGYNDKLRAQATQNIQIQSFLMGAFSAIGKERQIIRPISSQVKLMVQHSKLLKGPVETWAQRKKEAKNITTQLLQMSNISKDDINRYIKTADGSDAYLQALAFAIRLQKLPTSLQGHLLT